MLLVRLSIKPLKLVPPRNNRQGPGKAPDFLGHPPQRVQCRQCDPLQVVPRAHRLAGNALLDLLPDPLVGVEVGRVRWQEEQRDLPSSTVEPGGPVSKRTAPLDGP